MTYFAKQLEDSRKESIDSFWKSLLLLFEVSKDQFDEMPFEKQYYFQHEVFEALSKIIIKYFDRDGAGDKSHPNLGKILNELESYYEDYQIEENLRNEYMSNPPVGYTEKQISKMSFKELVDLDMKLTNFYGGWNEMEDPFAEKYKELLQNEEKV